MRRCLGLTLLTALAGCWSASHASALETEKLRLLSCAPKGADTPARREALAWRDALLASPDRGAAVLAGPLQLGAACLKNVSLDQAGAGAAGELCNAKPAVFAEALQEAGIVLAGGKAAQEKQALLFKEDDEMIYLLVEGVFGPMFSVTSEPNRYSFFCVAGPKEK